MRLEELTGLGARLADCRARFPSLLAATQRATLDQLARARTLRPGAPEPALELPRAFADALAAAVGVEERDATGRAEALLRHYLDFMPRLHIEQRCTRAEPAATFFQAPLEWDKLPHLSTALDRLAAELRDAGVPPPPLLGAARRAATVDALYAETYYGGFMPLLYGYPADLAFFARALERAPLAAVLDRYLAAPFVHELTHLHRARAAAYPLYLDECVAGYLGVRVLPAFAFPAAGDDNGLFASPWFAQVGQALARAAGWPRLLAAHAGALSWDEALPPGLAHALARLGWADYLDGRYLHLLSDNLRPDPWMKLFFLAAAGAPLDALTLPSLVRLPWAEVAPGDEAPLDGEILDWGLRAMCLRNYQNERSFRVETRAPPAPIDVDLHACRVSTAPGADGFDAARPAYLFPPAVAARLRARGCVGFTVELGDLAALPEVARRLHDGAPGRGPGFTVEAKL